MRKAAAFLFLLFSSAASAQDLSNLSKLMPEGDLSAAFSEQETVWTIRSSSPDFVLHDEINQKVLSRTVSGNQNVSLLKTLLSRLFCRASQTVSGSQTVILLKTGNFAGQEKLSPADAKIFLSATRFVHPSNPQILSISHKIFPSADPVEAVCRYVYNYISNKSLGMPLASDLQVLSLRAGDCKEHAVLAVSLLRSAGIPARAVTGLVLLSSFGGDRNLFGFHMWAEAYVGGRWVIADATYSGMGRYNRYIVLARHSLRTEAPVDYIEAAAAVNNLTIRRGAK